MVGHGGLGWRRDGEREREREREREKEDSREDEEKRLRRTTTTTTTTAYNRALLSLALRRVVVGHTAASN